MRSRIAASGLVFALLTLSGSATAQNSTPAPAPAVPSATNNATRPAVIGSAQPKPRTPGAIRLAAYNVENLFDNKDDPSLKGDEEDLDDTKPDEQLRALGDTFRKMDADIIGLTEIESYDALIAFRERFLKGQGYDHVISIDVGAERGIEQSVMSRFPIVDAQVWPTIALEGAHPAMFGDRPNKLAGKPLECRRSPLRVTIEVPAKGDEASAKPYRMTLFVVHQKAGRENDYWREAESKRFVQMVADFEKQNPGANIAVIGDFNAPPDADSVQTYVTFGLFDLLADRSPGDPTTITHASGRTIDYIFFNKALAPEIIKPSAFVLSTPQLDPLVDWRTAPKPEGYASDHLPVVVDVMPKDQ
jgi:hypothetical protein